MTIGEVIQAVYEASGYQPIEIAEPSAGPRVVTYWETEVASVLFAVLSFPRRSRQIRGAGRSGERTCQQGRAGG
jgi:hypothetical protein